MGWIRELFSTANKAIDKIPNEAEREKMRLELSKDIMNIEAELEIRVMEEATARYQKDLESSWLNKHIRAIVMLIYTTLIIVLPLIEAIPQHLMDLYSTIAMLIYGFYFGGKSLEKSVEIITLLKREK